MIDLNSLQVDKKTVSGGETVTMSLLAEDTQTGIASISVEYNVQGMTEYIYLEYNAVSNRYEGTITIDPYQKNATYVAKKIRANDHNWNQIILDAKTNDLSGLDFTVANEQQDIIAPTIEANSVKLVDDTLAVKVSDADSGIAAVRAVYESQYGEYILYSSPSEEWVNGDYIYLPFNFSETAVSQTLSLKQIIAYDKQGNVTILTRENANLAVGDYTFVQAETLVSIPVAEATFYDRNGNGQREATEQSVTGEIDGIYLQASDSGKIYNLDYQTGLHSFQVNGIENGVYELKGNQKAANLAKIKVTTIGKIEISGTPGNQQVTVLSELGVYKDGVSVELYASNIYHDENNNGIQEANEAIYTDKTEVEQIAGSDIYAAFDHLYIVDTNGNEYRLGVPGKGGEWRNVYAFDPATNQRVNLPYGEYEIMTDLPGKVITTENRFTINETNDSDLVKILKGIGIGSQRQAVNAPVITGVDAVTMFAGAQFDALAGVSAIDVEDGTVEVRISGEVDIFRVGEQLLTYTATDRDGNTTTVTRTITVLPGLAGNTLVDQSIQVNGQTILTLPYLTSEQLEHLQAGGTLTLTEGTLSHTVEGLVIDNGEYRFTLSGSMLVIEQLQATMRRNYELAYLPVATVDLLTGLVLSMDEIFLGTLTDVMVTATGLLVANFTEAAAEPDTGFGPNGDVTPELEGSQTPGLEATPETGFGPNGDVTPEVTPEAQSDANDEATLPETG
ncbi:MAG: immunoglobulin-like domain-containing protein, partial [Culicoidibacterales bacterium]